MTHPPRPLPSPRLALALVLAGLVSLGLVAIGVGCKDEAPAPPTVDDIVAESLRHEAAMLGILEAHHERPDEARRLLGDYVRTHEPELTALASRRDVLEHEPAAFATAVQGHAATMADNLARRRRLLTTAPTLMAEPEVRAALGRLAAL